MATPASRSSVFSSRAKKAYRLELEASTLYLLMGLAIVTGIVLYYLGVVSGLAMREPASPVSVASRVEPTDAAPAPQAEELAFNKELEKENPAQPGKTAIDEEVASRTQQLISESRKELELEETQGNRLESPVAPVRPAAPSPPASSSPSVPLTESPAAPSQAQAETSSPDSGLFSVQVFSSQSHERAQELITELKEKGFSAFLSRYETPERMVWYRVRIGKTSESEAHALAAKLQKEHNLKSTRVVKF
ncbi:MAG: SPOR domain-containing protein [Deltaproteobacteria bacterium]|nr:SPOR domain-containing protein [Deltaproteobacteria bacterium]